MTPAISHIIASSSDISIQKKTGEAAHFDGLRKGQVVKALRKLREATPKMGQSVALGWIFQGIVGVFLDDVEVEGLGRLSNRIVEGPTPIRDDVGAQPTESEEVISTAMGGDWEHRGKRAAKGEGAKHYKSTLDD